jgi:hypothetical protein
VVHEWELRPDELRLLTSAGQEADLIKRLRDELANAPLMLTGSLGAVVANPLIDEVRKHEALLQRLLASLGLDEADAVTSSSRAGSTLVGARWRRARGRHGT